MIKKHLDLLLKGKVQGIGFRYDIKEKADSIGLCGYARNLRDGSVSVEIEGDEKDIQMFVDWIGSNPGYSRIEESEKSEGEVKGFREFMVY